MAYSQDLILLLPLVSAVANNSLGKEASLLKQYNDVRVDKQRIKFLPEDPDLSHSQLWSWFTVSVRYPLFGQKEDS